jgi:D-alanyl-D-alanine carboxypeptidase (penicillin-binding protein 5/6)
MPPADEFAGLMELLRDEHEFPARGGGIDPAIRRRRRRRGLLVTAIVVGTVLAATGGYTGWALNAPINAPDVKTQVPEVSSPAAAPIALPAEGASAISISGADGYLGADAAGVWKSSGGEAPRPIASISKLITALVVLHAKPLKSATDPGPRITFDKAAHELYDKYYVMGATIAPMPTGSSMSERDALATTLIPSAANYAEAVADWAFGSPGGYVSAARKWLAANGLTGTTIVEPTGMSSRNVSTPGDLLTLGRLAAADPAIASITSTASLTLPGPGTMSNTNDLLGTDGITGLKTGNLGAGSHNLLYTASLDVGAGKPLRVTGVVLGGQSHESVDHDVRSLLDSIRKGFHDVPLATQGDSVGTYSTLWGSTAAMVIGEDASIFTWSDTPIVVTMKTTTPTSYQDGAVVGSVTWKAGATATTVPLKIRGSIAPPTAWWRLTHPLDLGGL